MKNGIVKRIKLKEGYEVYTNTVGHGKLPILLLHGGPGGCSECFEIMEEYLDLNQYSLIYYDQLGSYYSDSIEDENLLTLDRYVEEVEQVRQGLGLDRFVLLGHSWGGMLAVEYALKYRGLKALNGIVISNMTASNNSFEKSLAQRRKELLEPSELEYLEMIEAVGNYEDGRYKELVFGKLYSQCIFRGSELPRFLSEDKLARIVYKKFQGDNEFVVTGDLKDWDRWEDLKDIDVRTLVMGAQYDTMAVDDKKEMAGRIPNAELFICPDGSHFAYWDDSVNYFKGLNNFLDSL